MHKFKTFTAALTALPAAAPFAANDNKPKAKPQRIRSNTTLPALRWLYDNHPSLAPAMADAVKALVRTAWEPDAVDGALEIRPTIGEIIFAAADGKDADGNLQWSKPTAHKDRDDNPYIALGDLRFRGNELIEYGRTRKGRKLEPRDRMTPRSGDAEPTRNPNSYIRLRGAVASPMDSEPYRHSFSGEPALPPMYEPQRDVEANRAFLRALGVDGAVQFDDLPRPATKCQPAIAKGAEFLGGVVGTSGNSSNGALMWEAPRIVRGEARKVVEEVAARGTLQSIGAICGGDLEQGKAALVDAARILVAANDNKKQKKRAA